MSLARNSASFLFKYSVLVAEMRDRMKPVKKTNCGRINNDYFKDLVWH